MVDAMPVSGTPSDVARGRHDQLVDVGEKSSRRRQSFIPIRGLSKSFDQSVIYDQFDLDLPQGEFISIFGPNGCGKSTLINMISGLLPMDAGQVLFDGQTIQATRLSYVFQNYRDA